MKFKAQGKQNQLIEKNTPQHLVVGIDIAQLTHVACAVNFRGIAIGNPLSFSNEEEGFQILLRWIQSLQEVHNLNSAIIGMEPTGHYWLSVSRWLSEKQFEVVLVNPNLVKKNMENRVTFIIANAKYWGVMGVGTIHELGICTTISCNMNLQTEGDNMRVLFYFILYAIFTCLTLACINLFFIHIVYIGPPKCGSS